MSFNFTDSKLQFPICRFSKDFIYVQSTTEIENINSFSDSITLHIMNNYRKELCLLNEKLLSADDINQTFCKGIPLDKDTSAIHLQIPFGDGDEALINTDAYQNFDMAVPNGWSVSKWSKSAAGSAVNCSITSLTSRMVLEEYECISVQLRNIVSLCEAGATYMKIFVENVANVTALYKTFRLLKIQAPLKIMKFTAEHPVLAQGEKVKLTWSTAEKTDGKIMPNEFNISKGVIEYVEQLQKSKTYTLEIENEHESCKELCSAYVSPPIIRSFSVSVGASDVTAEWETEFTVVTRLNGIIQPNHGTCLYPKDINGITISSSGYLYSIEQTHYPQYIETVRLECRRWIFTDYTIIRVLWDKEKVVNCKLLVMEPEDHYILDLRNGVFEYVYRHPSIKPVSNDRLQMFFIDENSKKTSLYKSINWKNG